MVRCHEFQILAEFSGKKKKGFGLDLKVQLEILDVMYTVIHDMRCFHVPNKNKNCDEPTASSGVSASAINISSASQHPLRKIRKSRIQFQNGILISINSIKGLYKDMKEKYNLSFILTHRLNQDLLENYFSQIRLKGGANDHPTPLNCLQRMRLIILGRSFITLKREINTKVDDDDVWIVASVLQQSNSISMTKSKISNEDEDGYDLIISAEVDKLEKSHEEESKYNNNINPHENDNGVFPKITKEVNEIDK
jgi:hypothetical protein